MSSSAAEPNNQNVSPSIIPSSSSPLPPPDAGVDPRDVSGNGFNRFDPKYISIGPKATRNPLGSGPATANVNKCATLRHGGRYGNSAAASKLGSLKGGPQAPVVVGAGGVGAGVRNPLPPTVSTVSKEFGSFGSATLDRRTTSTFGGGALNNINETGSDKPMFTIEGSSSTFGRPIGNSQPGNATTNTSNTMANNMGKTQTDGMSGGSSSLIGGNAPSTAPKPISILNQPLPEIPQSAMKIDAPPPLPAANHNQPLSAANLSHYQMSNGPKSSFSMTSQLLQSGGTGNASTGVYGTNPGTAGNYPLKSSMKQQPASNHPTPSARPSIQQAPLPPPPVQQQQTQSKPQMFSSINSTKTLPPQLPPKNRHKEPTMTGQHAPQLQPQRQTLPNSKSQSAQFNKSNPQYATFMGYSENNNNKVVDSGDKARLIQQYYQETSNMRNNNSHHNQGMADYGTNMKMGGHQMSSGSRMPPQYSYQTLPHQPAKFSQQQQQQQQQAMMVQQQQYGQFAGGVHHQPQQQQQQQPGHHPNYNTSGKIGGGHSSSSVGTQVRHGGGAGMAGGKMDRNSNIEQMTYYRSLQRGVTREAGSANNDLYSVSGVGRVVRNGDESVHY